MTAEQRTPDTNTPGAGIERTLIRELLKLTPTERARLLAEDARNLENFVRAARIR